MDPKKNGPFAVKKGWFFCVGGPLHGRRPPEPVPFPPAQSNRHDRDIPFDTLDVTGVAIALSRGAGRVFRPVEAGVNPRVENKNCDVVSQP